MQEFYVETLFTFRIKKQRQQNYLQSERKRQKKELPTEMKKKDEVNSNNRNISHISG